MTILTHTFQGQFRHIHFRYSFNIHISGTVSTYTFQVQLQHTHFRCSFQTGIRQVQFQHTHFKRKLQLPHFNTQFQHAYISIQLNKTTTKFLYNKYHTSASQPKPSHSLAQLDQFPTYRHTVSVLQNRFSCRRFFCNFLNHQTIFP